jgi:CheY-like chemotaxis protein
MIPTSHRFPINWSPLNIPHACLEIMDTGCGIAEKDIENLFDPFFTTKFTGRGLGLSAAMGIIHAHRGGITVESRPDQGSIFRVFLPISANEIAALPEKTGKPPENKAIGITILLVDDEEQVRNMVKMMIRRMGFAVLEARDGVEAVELFQQHRDVIRCVLSDLTMPRMDGWETLAALRKLSPDIPVILSSGYDEAQVMAGEQPERPNAFLGKPYRHKSLRDAINLVL